jgi:hypothetical protein
MTQRQLTQVAKEEIKEWELPPGLVMAILFAYIHRVSTGETFEQTFFPPSQQTDYEI